MGAQPLALICVLCAPMGLFFTATLGSGPLLGLAAVSCLSFICGCHER